MTRKAPRVADLAVEAGLEVDEALVFLWEAGLEHLEFGVSRVWTRDIASARAALGLAGPRQVTRPEYWQVLFEMDPLTFDDLLGALDIRPAPFAKRLPKGAARKLKRWGKQNGLAKEPPLETPVAEAPVSVPEYKWRRIGRHPRPVTLSVPDIERIHLQLVDDFASDDDPIQPPGVRDPHLLASAAYRPLTSLGGYEKYPTAEMSTAALTHSLVHNHPFHNGNKRTALVAMLVQLEASNLALTCSDTDLFKFILRVAQHRVEPAGPDLPDRETAWVAEWITRNSRDVDKTQRPLQWRRLKRVLTEFDCEIRVAPGVGNRLNIERVVPFASGFLRRPRRRTLHSQVQWAGDGTDAEVSTIKKLRADLELDDIHGVDSRDFYNASHAQVAQDFIVRYRAMLRRLAQV